MAILTQNNSILFRRKRTRKQEKEGYNGHKMHTYVYMILCIKKHLIVSKKFYYILIQNKENFMKNAILLPKMLLRCLFFAENVLKSLKSVTITPQKNIIVRKVA
jgi:hypothetical protein